jgi:transcriptional regulator with XRE-family HTH domain
MTTALKSKLFRNYHNWSKELVAEKLNLSLDYYISFQKGISKIDGRLLQTMSELYHAPIELFLSDDTSHYYCSLPCFCSLPCHVVFQQQEFHLFDQTPHEFIYPRLKDLQSTLVHR